MLKLLRNDDVAADTSLREIQTFCSLCDRYGVTPIYAITPIGNVRPVHVSMDNATIRRVSGNRLFFDNKPVVEYLQFRYSDRFAVHGLWHTHTPDTFEIQTARGLIQIGGGLPVSHFVPPFNEGNYGEWVDDDLTVLGSGLPRIEDYLEAGDPQAEIMYTHSWRYEFGPFTWTAFDKCLARLTGRS